ncbi:MAG: helix-turn-helix transcriptional regulator [Saprospiraceae bacterium]|jgi:putative transcriptional regulator|nr:helix-turn-helix transcriptional regulator [Saprospiraceae bacterium]MDP4701592.1 helix-turn-helix transcriptional regulator [Saprospiraceae bacterium]MDP4809893.1 helix-turn-helix transcriptional regulator [Saprospiraceae bacterium]MDP4812922.1 helix-turn-helix transcriptional regulator [Saprospiraceae bacterium]MDP4912890.1 helix-turn-helix transcriptional regulator [Saprospiraceae bacterium]
MKNRIKVLRAELSISQDYLAQQLGVSRQTIHAIENNKYSPSLSLGMSIAKLFNKTVEEVFQMEEETDEEK